jgi:hypothetical protein
MTNQEEKKEKEKRRELVVKTHRGRIRMRRRRSKTYEEALFSVLFRSNLLFSPAWKRGLILNG